MGEDGTTDDRGGEIGGKINNSLAMESFLQTRQLNPFELPYQNNGRGEKNTRAILLLMDKVTTHKTESTSGANCPAN